MSEKKLMKHSLSLTNESVPKQANMKKKAKRPYYFYRFWPLARTLPITLIFMILYKHTANIFYYCAPVSDGPDALAVALTPNASAHR